MQDPWRHHGRGMCHVVSPQFHRANGLQTMWYARRGSLAAIYAAAGIVQTVSYSALIHTIVLARTPPTDISGHCAQLPQHPSRLLLRGEDDVGRAWSVCRLRWKKLGRDTSESQLSLISQLPTLSPGNPVRGTLKEQTQEGEEPVLPGPAGVPPRAPRIPPRHHLLPS